jgi:hypothetical protein
VYCDTDSVITTGTLTDEGKELGALGFQDSYERGTFIAPKIYMLEKSDGTRIVRAKGVPQSVAWDYIKNNNVSYSRPWRIKETWGSEHMPATWHVFDRQMSFVPSKRHVLNLPAIHELGGFSDTAPITFSMDNPDWLPDDGT